MGADSRMVGALWSVAAKTFSVLLVAFLFNHNGKKIEVKFSIIEFYKKIVVPKFCSQAADWQALTAKSNP